ncbi:uncharacterized protein YjbI with pentapeptide repeats [Paraburkholderia caballeronis]|uniref:DUF2169 family type VI secretion system accessory protein n=1 Tax=Paraburkholderia caballeronis TaxID=416943 RepID=UPI0010653ECD|nr:DUF2169 domain-containing protein [Paraburkholderia caballeronis]TDV28731.1 uncharacterized protein YjbI with pentapeptide repeats [Paraburkholderia caballeronis]
MKIIKPDNASVQYRSLKLAGRHLLAIGVYAAFGFEHPCLDSLLDDTAVWPLIEPILGKTALLDEGYPKPVGEYMLYGAAYAPEGRTIESQRVSVRVGALSKHLIVTGDRHFNALGLISAPKPFARMPIGRPTAFGGAAFADNVQGKGHAQAQNPDGTRGWPLPNVEYESRRIANRGDPGRPAGFWAFDIAAPLRQQHLGRCDERWLKHEWPHLPGDTRAELFMSAAPDQRLPSGYFAGNESFEIGNLHPHTSLLRGRLPGLRARCFVNVKTADGEVFSEVASHAETVWFFPEAECGVVLYRALVACADDAIDVKHVKAAWERLDDVPLPFAHYHAEFLRDIDPVADAYADADAEQPGPAMPPAEAAAGASVAATAAEASSAAQAGAASAQAAAQADAELVRVHGLADQLNVQTRELMLRHNLTDADLARYLPKPEPGEPPLTVAELHKLVDRLDADAQELMQKHKLTDADLDRYRLRPEPETPASFGDVDRMLAGMEARTRELMQKHNLTDADLARGLPPDVMQNLGGASLPAVPSADFAALGTLLAPPPAPKPPPIDIPPMQALPEEIAAASLTREDVIARHAIRASFAAHDLTGLDLSGLDLSSADFSNATLDKASFAGSRLDGAVFDRALLRGTDFGKAGLKRALLAQVSAAGSTFAQADLSGAQLADGDFTGADFSAACLAQAELQRAVFDKARLPGVDATACQAEQASFTGCDLGGAKFGRARVEGASFNESVLANCDFSGAVCQHTEFYGADAKQAGFADADLRQSRADANTCFDGARFTHAQLDRACWDGVQLRDASFESAQLDRADFSNVQATGARFRLASAQGARFDRADLDGAEMSAINLFGGSLRNANLSGTRLLDANLYGVDFVGAQPTLASVEGANIDRTILQFRPPVL